MKWYWFARVDGYSIFLMNDNPYYQFAIPNPSTNGLLFPRNYIVNTICGININAPVPNQNRLCHTCLQNLNEINPIEVHLQNHSAWVRLSIRPKQTFHFTQRCLIPAEPIRSVVAGVTNARWQWFKSCQPCI